MQSQGTVQPSLTSIRSPGTIYLDIICYLFSYMLFWIITYSFSITIGLFPLNTCSTVTISVIFLNFSKFYLASLNVTIIDIAEVIKITAAYE